MRLCNSFGAKNLQIHAYTHVKYISKWIIFHFKNCLDFFFIIIYFELSIKMIPSYYGHLSPISNFQFDTNHVANMKIDIPRKNCT